MRPHRLAMAIAGIVAAGWTGAAAILLTVAALPPERAGTVAVLFPPAVDGMSALAAVAAADGALVRTTVLPNIVIADGREPGFVGRLRAAGALAAYPPLDIGFVMIGGCTGQVPAR